MSFGNRNKTPCKYFQQGRCKKGNNCNFAHVYTNDNGNGSGGKNGGGDLYQNFINASNLGKYAKEVEDDMASASELKFQPLTSSYGLGTPCAVNLIQDRDLSPEESRFLYYQAQAQNSVPAYETQMQARASDSQFCRNFIAADTRKAARFLQLATQKAFETGAPLAKGFIDRPLDLTGNSYPPPTANSGASNLFGATGGSTQNPFGQQTNGTPFGIPTTNTQQSSGAFGKPAFGSSGASGAFGQPKFGSSGNQSSNSPAFGTSSFGTQPGVSAFGGGASAFGSKPSTSSFGANPSAFGSQPGGPAPSQPAFGSTNPAGSAFGKPSFGSTSSPQGPAFGSSGFAAPSSSAGPQTSSSPFSGSAFGKPAFGTGSGGSSQFGSIQNTQNSSPFGSIQNTQNASPFGSMANQPNSTTTSSPFGTSNTLEASQKPAEAPKAFGFGQNNNMGSGGFTSALAGNPFSSVQNPTQLPNNMGSFPTGISSQTGFVQGLPPAEQLSETDLPKEVVTYFKADRFELGKVPDIAPPLVLIN
ncbi:FG-nucleoporin NUP42 LALA0_S03e02894g [Lachancea lanzarotensis]|uniref:LALA0S03e02894g1_1 n=1 Tax=Lachancea lanzarotensis TaxID=1245769 RepID=A0A0C7N0E3_9SACH|nr:uncharacterized protein LALA0_S03e02894g [Lachancea lanzarotensis]CEP61439.1 LALA0S03e02894g1_1 [Lachancea lanzarotensis]